jgi:hypothetical protein
MRCVDKLEKWNAQGVGQCSASAVKEVVALPNVRRPCEHRPLLEVTPGRPWRDLGDRIVLFDQEEGVETVITGSGVTVWRMIAPRRRASEVTDELVTELGQGSPEFDEAMSFVDRLVESRVLRRG